MRRGIWMVIPVLVAGVIGGLVAIAGHSADAAFVYDQEHPSTIERLQVARAVQKAPEPVLGAHRKPGTDAKCNPGSQGFRHNPWRCVIRYASGHSYRFRVSIAPDGSWRGVDPTGERTISGCCIVAGRVGG